MQEKVSIARSWLSLKQRCFSRLDGSLDVVMQTRAFFAPVSMCWFVSEVRIGVSVNPPKPGVTK